MSKKYRDLLESLKTAQTIPEPKTSLTETLREAYIEEKIFNVGDKVQIGDEVAEIIARGPNYVTLIKEGKTFKKWLDDVKPVQIDESHKRNSQLYKESFIIKGYKTKNFTRELSEQFKKVSSSNSDIFALYNTVVCFDHLLGMTEESLRENFDKYKISYDRVNRYSKKFDLHLEQLSNIEDMLLSYSIEEDVKFNAADQMKIATIIASTAGVETEGSAVSIINLAAKKFKSGSHTPEAWKIIGQMLKKADQAKISWDHNIFAKPTLKYMGLL